MGSAASIQTELELLDQSPAPSTLSPPQAVAEVARLRQMIHDLHTSQSLPDTWQAVYDDVSGHTYYWQTTTGIVSWTHPSHASLQNITSVHPPPTPTATATDIPTATFVESYKAYQSLLAKAARTVMKQINRQQVRWEHDWHQQLLDYVSELRVDVQALRDQQRTTTDAALVQHDKADKKADRLTKSVSDRATDVVEQAEAHAEAHQQEMAQKKHDRHQALMVKLAARKKKHQEKLNEARQQHAVLVTKISQHYLTSRDAFGENMREQHARTSSWHTGDNGIDGDKTGGWVMLFDQGTKKVYFWHPVKGSTWVRPPEMEFNLNLNQLFGNKHAFSNALEEVGDLSAGLLEKWYLDFSIEKEMLEDVALEEEIALLEDELKKRRRNSCTAEDLALLKVEGVVDASVC